ncbi:nucleotide exchange factor SIL1-like [Sitophilus oryzae]|uniref:Nucleotide exchange factor SIL1 n=1 Tax=Sitophilus oryzae TaxID=7048 RepID=A0A6J2XSV0_SITOR|nr:nucleotide exchange factor SIL1-like [Sitophilus oryzae]
MCFEIFFHSKMNFNIILVLLILFSNSICEDKQDTESDEIFVPTKEWKVIKAGQKVPSGLHYRINLSTGKKEAKINEDDESDTNKKGISVIKEDETLYSALKDVDKKNPENDMPKKFRTLDEIKKDLGDIEITPKSDVEILQDLFAKFQEEDKKKQPNTKEILKILKDLIYLSHQIDNGNEFVRMDGFKKIVYKKLNSTNLAVKQEALKLFSTLAQNSPKVKVHILETGGITILLRLLNLDDNPHIKNSAVTALSCTLRTFPYAQNRFIEAGGLTIFSSLFKSGSVKLKLKLVTLLNDFIIERQKDVSNFENHELVDIEEKIIRS